MHRHPHPSNIAVLTISHAALLPTRRPTMTDMTRRARRPLRESILGGYCFIYLQKRASGFNY